jgi:uncharacterized protein YjdB
VSDAPVLSAIGGPANICTGTPDTLTNTATGGVWTSGNTAVATIDPTTGVITGISAGTAVISYQVTASAGCSTITLTTETVNTSPTVSATTGTTAICTGSSSTLTNTTTGGVWSNSNPTITTVTATGDVTGLMAGTDTVSYTVTNVAGCSTAAATTFTVHPLPAITGIAGGPNACLGSTLALTVTGADSATTTGVWTSDNASIASIDATTGVLSGIATGTANISYTATNSFGCTTTVTTAITVNALPTVAAISGPSSLCEGSATLLSSSTTGGVWSSADTLLATVASSGVVTGVSAGTVTISYTVTAATGCVASAVHSITINPAPSVSAISGATALCTGATSVYTNASAGGTWSSSDIAIATVSTTGSVTAISAGTFTLNYTITGGFGCTGTATLAVTVSDRPTVSAISGSSRVCVGATISLTDTTIGGAWSSSSSAATIDGTGLVTGVTAGTATISYTVTNAAGCSASATTTITIDAAPTTPVISGSVGVCTGSTATLTATPTGGNWTSSDAAVASISSTGILSGIANGSATIAYTITNAAGCSAAATIAATVNPAPTATLIPTGSITLCSGVPANLTVSATGATAYQWYKNSIAVAGATNATYNTDSAGLYTVGVSNGGCTIVVGSATVQLPPNPVISRGTGTVLFTGSFSSYQWYLNGVAIPGATFATYNATTPGTYTVMVTDGNGCSRTSAAYIMTGGPSSVATINTADIKWYPNPATSQISIESPVAVKVAVISPDGKIVLSATDVTTINVSSLSTGVYLLLIYDLNTNNLIKTDRFMKAE